MDSDRMNPIEQLVALKRQEQELKSALKSAQEEASAYALSLGKQGKLGEFAGAQVTLRLVTVKPKDTAEIEDLRESLELRQKTNRYARKEQVEKLEEQAERLRAEVAQIEALRDELLEDEETQRLRAEIDELLTQQQGEKKPQLAISFKA